MKKLLIFLTLLSFPACAQVLDTSKLDAKITLQDAQIADILKRLEKLETATAQPPAPVLPYPNFENSKYTFPDAKEYPALDVMKMTSEYIKFNADGSITYSLPAGLTGTPTANAKYLRMERREYEVMATKENYEKGDVLKRSNCVIFHKLNLGVADVVFTQVHGTPWVVNGKSSDTPYFKWVAGKDGVRGQFKTKWGLSDDDKVISLLPKSELVEGKEYCYKWTLDGVKFTYEFAGNAGSVTFDRPDEYYPKDGAYGPVGVSLTHRAW
jgi:hypothetical protein